MAEWTNNNRACTVLWTSLYIMKQLRTNFAKSGALKMNDLLFFNSAVSADLRRQDAEIVADELDLIFRKSGFGALFEKGVDRAKATTDIVSVLIDGTKNVAELASAIDDDYAFWQEKR